MTVSIVTGWGYATPFSCTDQTPHDSFWYFTYQCVARTSSPTSDTCI